MQKPKKGVVLLPQRLPEPLQAVTSLLQAVIKHFRFVTELLKCCYHQAVAKTFYNTNINICNATTLDSLKPQQHQKMSQSVVSSELLTRPGNDRTRIRSLVKM